MQIFWEGITKTYANIILLLMSLRKTKGLIGLGVESCERSMQGKGLQITYHKDTWRTEAHACQWKKIPRTGKQRVISQSHCL